MSIAEAMLDDLTNVSELRDQLALSLHNGVPCWLHVAVTDCYVELGRVQLLPTPSEATVRNAVGRARVLLDLCADIPSTGSYRPILRRQG
jgi:hypothetical protein